MQKYNLLSVVRRKKYRNYGEYLHRYPNLLNRNFKADCPNQKYFFSILKTECIYRTKFQTLEDASILIDEYIHFYNHERIQLKTKLTPFEKRSQYVA